MVNKIIRLGWLCDYIENIFVYYNKAALPSFNIAMPRHSNLIHLRNTQIKARFTHWCNKKDGEVQMYGYEYILNKLTEEFFLSPKTIENIIKK